MSTLRIGTLESLSGSNSVSQTTIFSGTAKAWSNLDGTGTIAERDSFNISSYTDNGTGNYDVNLSSALADTNQSVFMSSASGAPVSTNRNVWQHAVLETSSLINLNNYNASVGQFDMAYNYSSGLGVLA